jgi:hypothetical protein
MAQEVAHLPRKLKALSSNASITKKIKKSNELNLQSTDF